MCESKETTHMAGQSEMTIVKRSSSLVSVERCSHASKGPREFPGCPDVVALFCVAVVFLGGAGLVSSSQTIGLSPVISPNSFPGFLCDGFQLAFGPSSCREGGTKGSWSPQRRRPGEEVLGNVTRSSGRWTVDDRSKRSSGPHGWVLRRAL